MTNLTNQTTNSTNLEGNNMNNSQAVLTNIDAKISALVAVLYSHGMTPVHSTVVAAALMDNQMYMAKGMKKWTRKMDKAIRSTTIVVEDESAAGIIIEGWMDILLRADLVTEEGQPGEYMIALDAQKEKHYPALACKGIVERKKSTRTKTSKLFEDAKHVLERTQYTVNEYMHQVAGKVKDEDIAKSRNHKGEAVFEMYVYLGCAKLLEEGNYPRVSEFFGDTRGRFNHAACHGPNGQSSDYARSMQDLHGVSMDYNPKKALKVLEAELADMHKYDDVEGVIKGIESASSFILCELKKGQKSLCKKPWSFIKAIVIRSRLKKHIKNPSVHAKPYIGMAFGLDAKCSGPQLGALQAGDEFIAQACGFTTHKVADAYAMATQACLAAGFGNIPREVIKTPYMGVFYGQGYLAFCNFEEDELKDDNFRALIEIIKDGPKADMEANAQHFHRAVESSFGKMSGIRKAILNMHRWYDKDGNVQYHTHKATTHLMPDGFTVSMNYKIEVNIAGTVISRDNPALDVTVICGVVEHKFEKMKFRTKADALGDYARTGYVNFIQATDALLARLIITHLDQVGECDHVISVHDCFRVNINDMIAGKLHNAIKAAYMELFGNKKDESRGYLRQGTDMLKLYFDGVNDAREHNGQVMSQFDIDGDRFMDDIMDEEIVDLIDDLRSDLNDEGDAYFFAK